MRVEQITLRELHMDLVAPFQTSMGTTTLRRILLVEAVVDGVTGWGECVAGENPSYSPETTETAWHVLHDYLWPLLKGKQLESAAEVWQRLAWVRGLTRGSPAQASRQTSQPQFHWGKPPPAAAPSTKADRRLMRRLSRQPSDFESERDVRSELGRQVAVDLEADADLDKDRGRPRHGTLREIL